MPEQCSTDSGAVSQLSIEETFTLLRSKVEDQIDEIRTQGESTKTTRDQLNALKSQIQHLAPPNLDKVSSSDKRPEEVLERSDKPSFVDHQTPLTKEILAKQIKKRREMQNIQDEELSQRITEHKRLLYEFETTYQDSPDAAEGTL